MSHGESLPAYAKRELPPTNQYNHYGITEPPKNVSRPPVIAAPLPKSEGHVVFKDPNDPVRIPSDFQLILK